MTWGETVTTIVVPIIAGLSGGGLYRLLTYRYDRAKSAAETSKLEAETRQIQSTTSADQIRQAMLLLERYQAELTELRTALDLLETHVDDLEVIMRGAGLAVPDRPRLARV